MNGLDLRAEVTEKDGLDFSTTEQASLTRSTFHRNGRNFAPRMRAGG